MATSINVSLKDLPARMMLDLRATQKDLERSLYVAAVRGIRNITQTINDTRPFPPIDRGLYRASWQAEQIEGGGVLFSDNPLAQIIEHGTRPFFPNLKAIAEWVKRKFRGDLGRDYRASVRVAKGIKGLGMLAGEKEAGGVAISRDDYVEMKAAGIALAICRKIAAHGMPPKKILQNTMPDLEQVAVEEMERVCRAAG